jgi:O-antigen/teichoic acid export membrane protein
MAISDKIIRNTAANAFGKCFDVVALLILTPLTFKYLGVRLYGLWSIVFVLVGYFRFVDFGIDQSYVKFIAEHKTKNDTLVLNKILSTGFFFYLLIGSIAAFLVYFNIDFIVFKLLKIPIEYSEVAKASILLGFTAGCVNNVFKCFKGLLNGMQRMELSNAIDVIARLLAFIGTLTVIHNDWGVLGLTINASIRILVIVVMSLIAGIKIFPQLKISIFLIDKQIFKQLFNYGYKLQIVTFAAVVKYNFVQIVLSNIVGLSYVSYYSIGMKVAKYIYIFPQFLFSALTPAISELYTRKRKEVINQIYHKGSKYISFLTTWLIFGSSLVIPYVFYVWLGARNHELSSTCYLVLISMGIRIALCGVASSILRGIGIVKHVMQTAIIHSVIILALGVIITRDFGFNGLLLLMFFAASISSIYFCIKFNRIFKRKPFLLLKQVTLLPFLLGLALFGFFKWIILIFDLTSTSKTENVAYIVMLSLIFSLAYFIIASLLKYFSREEIQYLKAKYKTFLTLFNINSKQAREEYTSDDY